jgi:hypothetical protein
MPHSKILVLRASGSGAELKPNQLHTIRRAESGIVVHDTQGEVGPDAKDIDFFGFFRCRAT